MSSSVKAVNAVMPIEMIVAPSISRLLSLQVQNPSCYDTRLIHYVNIGKRIRESKQKAA